MAIYDISVPIAPGSTPTFPGDPGIEVTAWTAIARGNIANVSLLHFGAHTGTHIDAPAHFIEGATGTHEIPLDALIGVAHVIEMSEDIIAIEASHVYELVPLEATRVIFKTRNSALWAESRGVFREDFSYIAPSAARALAERDVRLVGFDYLSVEEFKSHDYDTHRALLSKGVVIVEGLDLSAIDAGTYELICLPLRISSGSGDGAPARAVLRTLSDE
jgi:arylformamidase